MLKPEFISKNSRLMESLLEHRFLYDLGKHLLLTKQPRVMNVLKSEVDMFGFDLVLATADRTVHIQMKTRSGKPTNSPFNLSEQLWKIRDAGTIWMLYDAGTLEPTNYSVLGFPMPPLNGFGKSERHGFRSVKMQQANHRRLSLGAVADLLFP